MKFTKENIISHESKVRSQECSSGFYDQERFRHYYSFNDNFPQSSYRTANEIIKNILNLRSSHSIEPLHCDKTKYGGMYHYHSNENQHNGTGNEMSTPGVYELPYPKPYQQINQKADREPGDTDGEKTISQLTNIETEDQMQPGSQLPGVVWNPVFLSKPMKSERVDEVTCKRCPNCMKHKAAPERRELLKYICPKNDKEFVCLYKNCGKNFTRRYNILSHIQTHLNIRQFTCKVCFKSFVRRHDLNRHSKSHLSPRKYENVFSSMVRARPRSEWSDYEIVIDDGRCTCG